MKPKITTLGDLFAEEEQRLSAKARAEMEDEDAYWRTHPEELAERLEAFDKKAAIFDDCEE